MMMGVYDHCLCLIGNVRFANILSVLSFGLQKSSRETIAELCSDALLVCDRQQLSNWLCEKQITAAGEIVRKPLTHAQVF